MTDRMEPMSDPGGAEMPDEDSAFTERIAAPLRTPVYLDERFDGRVMAAVAAVARARQATRSPSGGTASHWLLRPRSIRVTPLLALAAAAAFAGLVLLGAEALRSTGIGSRPAGQETRAAVPDTVHLIRFVFLDETAESVHLVGDFNAWTNGATPLEAQGKDGVWTAAVALPPGRHEYAFIVNDGESRRWVADPLAPVVRDEYDTESSFILLGAGQASGAGRSDS
jgi:hypothetical protein